MSIGCFFLWHPLTIQLDIRPDTGYPARPDIRQNRLVGYPAAGYPANSVSGATLFLTFYILIVMIRVCVNLIWQKIVMNYEGRMAMFATQRY